MTKRTNKKPKTQVERMWKWVGKTLSDEKATKKVKAKNAEILYDNEIKLKELELKYNAQIDSQQIKDINKLIDDNYIDFEPSDLGARDTSTGRPLKNIKPKKNHLN